MKTFLLILGGWSVALAISLSLSGCGRLCAPDADLNAVDKAVANAGIAQDSLEIELSAEAARVAAISPGSERLDSELAIADRYMSFDLERALEHLNAAARIASAYCSDVELTEVMIKIASLYNSQGQMLKEAADIFATLNTADLPDRVKVRYFILGVQLNRNLAERSFDPRLRSKYRADMTAFRDSVLAIDPESVIISVNKMLDAGDLEAAESTVLKELSKMDGDGSIAPLSHVLAGIYERLGETGKQEYYLAQAAVADLRSGTREYRALIDLAMLMFAEGKTSAAYRYIHRAADDADASRSHRRQMEVAPLLSAIDTAYAQMKVSQTHTLLLGGVIILFVAVLAVVAYFVLRRKNRRLRSFTSMLENANQELTKSYETQRCLNETIAEESRVKEQYITGFMEQCLEYLQKMERFRAELNKIAARRDIDALTKAITSSRYVNREVADFYAKFDRAFLDLYPDFIDELNSLLKEEYRFAKSGSFTTELRIYALIRLGITASGAIARFLRCSDSTVYNYRTVMRNKAIDRDGFEEKIAQIRCPEV